MNKQQNHEMIFAGTLPSGAEEWSCPICGRRTLINWEPEFKRTILEAGDGFAVHSAVKANPPDDPSQFGGVDEQSQPHNEDYRLGPWIDWLNKIDFDNLWYDDH